MNMDLLQRYCRGIIEILYEFIIEVLIVFNAKVWNFHQK